MAGRVRSVYKGKVLKLNIERVKLPNGSVAELEIAHHPGGAVVVALDADGRVCVLRQYRHAAGGWIIELPAGKIDNREPPLACAKRELAEEAGVTARHWKRLGQFFSSPGVFTEVIHVFLARGLSPCDSVPETHEVLEARWVPMVEATALAAKGRLPDAKTTIGLFWAQTRLQLERRTPGPGPERDARLKLAAPGFVALRQEPSVWEKEQNHGRRTVRQAASQANPGTRRGRYRAGPARRG